MSLEKSLYDFISRELHELSWICDYPINPNISLWCFVQAFQENDFEVKINDKTKEATFSSLRHIQDGDTKLFSTILSYDEILYGWKIHPKNSPQSLYDSICIVYDKFGEEIADKNSIKDDSWFYVRHYETKEIKKSMEEYLLPYFIEHHEHMLIPVSGKVPELKEPVIFNKIIKNFPMDIFRKSIIYRASTGPCAENIPKLNLESLDSEDFYPSETSMTDYFLGLYLNELSKEKNYSLWYESKNSLRDLIIQRQKAFKTGSMIKWGN